MIETWSHSKSRAIVASFLFTDLVGFSKGTAAEQYAAKAELSSILHRELEPLNERDYWIKDTGDGALIAFVSNPEHALYMALALGCGYDDTTRAGGAASNRLRTGLHVGTVKESIDLEARRDFVGDGINAAKRIMDFAQPGQITASQSFYEAIANLDAEYAALFRHVGAPDDKHGRVHELYVLTPGERVLDRLRADLAAGDRGGEEGGADRDSAAAGNTRPAPDSRPAATLAAKTVLLAVVVVLGVGGVASIFLSGRHAPPVPAALPMVRSPVTAPDPAQGPAGPGQPATTSTADNGAGDSRVAAAPPAPAASDSRRASASTASSPSAASSAAKLGMVPPKVAAAARTPVSAAPTVPAASDPSPGRPDPRCNRIVEKAAVGDPLTPEEKRSLASSCR